MTNKKTSISIIGAGYVGYSLGILLARNNNVKILDIDKSKVELINNNKSPIEDNYIDEFIKKNELDLCATQDKEDALSNSEHIIIATPTNYDESLDYFDTTSVEEAISQSIKYNKEALIIIKSTIPIGFTDKIIQKFKYEDIVFSPEFLREGRALEDNLYPSRIIVSNNSNKSQEFANLLKDNAIRKDIECFFPSIKESECIKLFSNTFLAMRVGFFNELDSYALVNNLNTKHIIDGVCSDDRIGNYYNNPSFGYGGYCLPKDTKQLLSNFSDIPQNLLKAIVDTNETRKELLINHIKSLNVRSVGIYRLQMKKDSDNFRESSIYDILNGLFMNKINTLIYEPIIKAKSYKGYKVEKDINKFKNYCDLIIANRVDKELHDVKDKLFSRDIFMENSDK
jgi:UDPglucose 6-dehydrogenase